VISPPVEVRVVASTEALTRMQQICRSVYVDPGLIQYAVRLVATTRRPAQQGLPDLARFLTFGASPRASIALVEGARALALMRGRSYALPDDLADLVHDSLRHRLVLSYEALAEGVSADDLIARVVAAVPLPKAVAGP
jgi:MoxR-like ATPase